MSATKSALKAAKAALDAHRYPEAIDHANTVLAADPGNYNANVFLGLASEKVGRYDAAEKAYEAAVSSRDKDPLAWQGLVTLYEKQASKELDKYHDAAVHLAEIYMEKDDKTRCQSVLDKYVGDAKKYGSRTEFKRSLEIYLPTGPLYDYLEGRVPQPAQTYSRIVDIVEEEEKEKINTEIGQRRTRLGARIDQVTTDVKREVLGISQLEDLYGAIIDWTHDDEVRRQYEGKLLNHAFDTLAVTPIEKKAPKREQVIKLAEGFVILKVPFLLAWKIKLEWTDVEEIGQLDVGVLKDFTLLFPEEGLTKVLQGYLNSEISPFPQGDSVLEAIKHKEEETGDRSSDEDRLLLMTEGMEDSAYSILAHRMMGSYYLFLEEFESAAETSREGLKRLVSESQLSNLPLRNSFDAVNVILATALVQYQAPRHHPEAREIFETVLRQKPTDTSALLGIGLILEEQGEFTAAVDFLDRALERSSDPKLRAEAAWCKALEGNNQIGLRELEACLPEMDGSDKRTKSLRSQTLYRIGMCMWTQDASATTRKDRNGPYARFLASLQADMNFAPAYTSLGIYYADYAKDGKRARKCFRKAFELSSSEVEAAERLARSFADSNEWDLVEVVAQRVIESGKVKSAPGSKKNRISWPFAALGVAQLNSQEYAKAVVSFQSALRISPSESHCWVGLGESYHHSGRYVAATKALEQAQKLEDVAEEGDIKGNWFSQYMLANVRRELGEYDDAISGYKGVLKSRPREFGVSIALLQCLVESAWQSIELGFFGRGADAASEAIRNAHVIAKNCSGAFNLWKAVGDACSVVTYAQKYANVLPVQMVRSLLEFDISLETYELLADIDGLGRKTLESLVESGADVEPHVLGIRAAVLAQKRAIHACANDIHARAVAWYNLGWTEHRAHIVSNQGKEPSSKRKELKYLKASVQCFKRAIELEARNAEFWNSLGVVTTNLSPKVSQHSFVRSLYLNDKNARVWTNFGTLCLIQGDTQLANEAFTRAQSSDPDYAQAWVGQGLLATQMGDPNEARILFTHAFEIADSSSMIVKRQYAVSIFDDLLSPTCSNVDVLQPLLALYQLRSQLASDLAFQHLSSLFDERVGDFPSQIANLDLIASNLEQEYEDSESTVTLLRFAQVKADIARGHLAVKNFETAALDAETALNLSDDDALEEQARHKVRVSAHITAGLAYNYQGKMDEAINMFRTALEETHGNPDIICLLAQVLWAKGGDQERDVAREQLLGCVEKYPRHVGAILLLGAIAVLDEDRDTIEAVSTDLQDLRTRDDLDAQEQSKVATLLRALATLFPEGDKHSSEIAAATTAAMLAPSKPHGWSQLAELSGESYPAEMTVLAATKAAPPGGSLGADDLCRAYVGTGTFDDAQRAVVTAPWMAEGWEALAG